MERNYKKVIVGVHRPGGGEILKMGRGKSHGRSGYPLHRENRKNGKKDTLSRKTQEIWKFCQNTGNSESVSPKFIDSKEQGYCDICRNISQLFRMCLPSQFCI